MYGAWTLAEILFSALFSLGW